MRRGAPLLLHAAGAVALHEHTAPHAQAGCVAPGICTPPDTKYSRVPVGPKPGHQWNINGGFCGAWSTQQSGLSAGAWVSQDLVRKANKDSPGEHKMHGDTTKGYEVMPGNVAFTAASLKFSYDEFDYKQPKPQAAAYKKWLKSHLAQGHPVVWFPLCKGDGHTCYSGANQSVDGGGDCPNGGHADHVEPIFGIFSDHPLNDSTVYADDWILHGSDQDMEPYYRKMSTLEDDLSMTGNCKDAGAGFGKNEMYPCFYEQVAYGLAVTGLAVEGTLPVALSVDLGASGSEPNVRLFGKATPLHGTVTVSGLRAGAQYVLYRFGSTATLPAAAPFTGYEHKTPFTAEGATWTYKDPDTFLSSGATYYIAVEE